MGNYMLHATIESSEYLMGKSVWEQNYFVSHPRGLVLPIPKAVFGNYLSASMKQLRSMSDADIATALGTSANYAATLRAITEERLAKELHINATGTEVIPGIRQLANGSAVVTGVLAPRVQPRKKSKKRLLRELLPIGVASAYVVENNASIVTSNGHGAIEIRSITGSTPLIIVVEATSRFRAIFNGLRYDKNYYGDRPLYIIAATTDQPIVIGPISGSFNTMGDGEIDTIYNICYKIASGDSEHNIADAVVEAKLIAADHGFGDVFIIAGSPDYDNDGMNMEIADLAKFASVYVNKNYLWGNQPLLESNGVKLFKSNTGVWFAKYTQLLEAIKQASIIPMRGVREGFKIVQMVKRVSVHELARAMGVTSRHVLYATDPRKADPPHVLIKGKEELLVSYRHQPYGMAKVFAIGAHNKKLDVGQLAIVFEKRLDQLLA